MAYPVARTTDPVTSHEAGHCAALNTKARRTVFDAAHWLGTFTDLQLAHWINSAHPPGSPHRMNAGSVQKRRLDLEREGLIERTDERRLQSGRNRIVFRAVKP